MRWILLLLLALGLVVLVYWLSKTEPAFDLDKFNSQVSKLQIAYKASSSMSEKRVPDYLKPEVAYLQALGKLMSEHEDDCLATVEAMRNRHATFRTELEAIPTKMTSEDLAQLPRPKRQEVARKIVNALAPAFADLRPSVKEFAEACPEESAVLDQILGSVRME